jgi:hypothetical protein
MKQHKKHRLWIAGVTILALCSFLTGTSLACFQRGIATIKMAENCCQSHCQHAMTGEVAADCCQSHHGQASHAFPLSSSAKTFLFMAGLPPAALLPLAVWQSQEQFWMHSSRQEHPPSSPSLYTLHCTLLI